MFLCASVGFVCALVWVCVCVRVCAFVCVYVFVFGVLGLSVLCYFSVMAIYFCVCFVYVYVCVCSGLLVVM